MPVAIDHDDNQVIEHHGRARRAGSGVSQGRSGDHARPVAGRQPRPRRRTRSALDVLVVGAIAYGGAAILNANHLHRQAERLPLKAATRPVALAASGSVRWASRLVGLDRPGRLVDEARGPDPSRPSPSVAAKTAAAAALAPSAAAPESVPATVTTTARASAANTPTSSTTTTTIDHAAVGRSSADRLTRDSAPSIGASDRATISADAAMRAPASRIASVSSASGPTTVPATTTPATTAPATTTTLPHPKLRTPTADDPWRVYMGGDSLAQGVGPALARIGTESKLMQVQPRGVISSGLSRPDTFNWPAEIADVARTPAEIVVVIFGANDPQAMSTLSGTLEFGTPAWQAEYRHRVDSVMDELGGKVLVWLGMPVVGRTELERQVRVLDRIYREAAAAHPMVQYIDVRALTSSDGATYEPYLDGGDGEQFLARTNDRVHFTTRGYDLLASAVTARLLELTR